MRMSLGCCWTVMGELEPEPELAEDTLGGRISDRQSGAGPTWSGSWWMWASPVTGGSTIPHVRMCERLQSSQAHLSGEEGQLPGRPERVGPTLRPAAPPARAHRLR